MASWLPVVTTACWSNHEAVRPPNLRVADDAEALAEALAGSGPRPRRSP
jgi:phosphatidyl-myo-inositol dimannoside synthase